MGIFDFLKKKQEKKEEKENTELAEEMIENIENTEQLMTNREYKEVQHNYGKDHLEKMDMDIEEEVEEEKYE